MKLPRLAIDNYQFTLIVFILLSIAGVSSYLNMPRSENPVVYIPGGAIVVIYPGASPLDMEQLIARPIEEAINELDDIKEIKTKVTDGIASIQVEFEYNSKSDGKYDEMVRQVNSIRNELPENIFDIITRQYSSTDVAMIQLAFVSEKTEYMTLSNHAERLKKELNKIKNIKDVEVMAYPNQEVRISIDMEAMAKMNISLDNVINAINSNNANIPGGNMSVSGKTFAIKTSGPYSNLDEIRNTVINSYMGRLIYLHNIATVDFDYENEMYYGRFIGERALFLTIKSKDGINIFDLTEEIMPVINKYKNTLDNGISLEMVFDQSKIVESRISGFLNNLISGILLVGIVILLALGFRSSVIVIIAIPLSIVIGLFFVDSYGLGLQQITIAGLVVALGLLVDNSIVIIENINRYIAMGHKPREAAILGTAQIGWPIISSTITTILAFVPIILMPDKAGDFIRGLPVTIIATLTISLIIALTLSPMIARLVFKAKKIDKGAPEAKSNNEKGFQKLLKRFIDGPYRRILSFSLKRKGIVMLFSALALAGAGLLFVKEVRISFFPTSETPQLLIRVNLPEGSNLKVSDDAAKYAESVLDTIDLVSHYATNIGHGNPRIYYAVFSKNYARNYADIYVQLKRYEMTEFNNLVTALRKKLFEYPGAKFNVTIFEQGVPIDAPVMIYINGDNVDTLRSISQKVEGLLKEQVGIINIENHLDKNQTDLFVNINREKANMFGVPVHEIDKTVRAAMNGLNIASFKDEIGEEYNIVVRLPIDSAVTIDDFDKIFVASLSGKFIPLKQLAAIEFRNSPSIIERRDLTRTALVKGNLLPGVSIDDVMAPVLAELEVYDFPVGYDYSIDGEIKARSETFGGMGMALMVAVIAIFAVLVLQFRSFIQPIIIFVSFILAFIGVSLALFISQNPFSFTAFIGFISLAGIVVNNAIILIDYTNKLRDEGKSVFDALMEAGQTRFTAIILTTLTTIGGLLPLTLRGGEMWAPLGWTIIGGLLVSTIFTLVVVPVLYMLADHLVQKVNKVFRS